MGVAVSWLSCAGAATPPSYEVIKSNTEVEVEPGGAYAESREQVYRVLTEEGAAALRQINLYYTDGYQSFRVLHAYTLKKDGTRIDVPPQSMMSGYGTTNSPGFEDLKTISVVFPNLEVGDEIAITTIFHQIKPWFGQSYSEDFVYGRSVVASDVSIALTAPTAMALQIDASGFKQDPPEEMDGMTRRVWHFENRTAVDPEEAQVDDYDFGSKLVISTFKDFHEFAGVYAGLLKDRTEVTPEIKQLADSLTVGLKTDADRARALYNWVSTHVAYLNIVLGAGGFVPHKASEVLASKYGDCKDHVILLQALLAAKGIYSMPVLINAQGRFTLSPSPSPGAFNHLISYIPAQKLYLDSTARYAPFGVLPYSDASKPVVRIEDGVTARTPRVAAGDASVRSVADVKVAADGSAEGDTQVTATGAPAIDLRALMTAINAAGPSDYFQKMMAPGIEASLDLGNINDLSPVYHYSAHYRQPSALNVPGPGVIPFYLAYKPFSFTGLIAANLPATRLKPYVCNSMDAEEDLTIHVPANLHITSLPPTQTFTAEGVVLSLAYSRPDGATIRSDIKVRVDHPAGSCSPAYYAQVRASLAQMANALRAQILYQ